MPDKTEDKPSAAQTEKPQFLTKIRFDELNIHSQVLSGLKDLDFTFCTPIQEQVLPISLTGRDIAGQAQTGTGKTAAFLVTLFTNLLTGPPIDHEIPSALIVAPTRELAIQIFEEAKLVGSHTGLHVALVVGGIDYRKQADVLRKGTDIVICTPGRIIDYYKQGIFKTTCIRIVVIDEADRLLDLGFSKDMRYIFRSLPHYEKRQSLLFSATLSYRVLELTYDYMNMPEFISVTPETMTVEGIDQSLFYVSTEEKLSLLLGLLKREEWNRVLIFANTKSGVEWLSKKIKGNGFPAAAITGDLEQRKRLRLMEQFKSGKTRILVATDVASRGIHVEDISHVINYDLPQEAENYVHRIGRTARAGKTGRSFSLACESYAYHLEPIEEMLGYKIKVVWPESDWLMEDKAGPVHTGRRKPARKAGVGRRINRPSPRQGPAKRASGSDRGSRPDSRPAPRPGSRPAPRPDSRPSPRPGNRPLPKRGTVFGFLAEAQAAGKAADKASSEMKKKKMPRRKKKRPDEKSTSMPDRNQSEEKI